MQFFYFDSIESLPREPLSADEVAPLGSRYDAQIAVFGRTLQKKLQDAQTFVVGAGALGCEFLKNLALMGVSTSDNGCLTVTDDDTIEKSNLSRQFLFRDWNIGQAKSAVAAAAAKAINPELKVRITRPLEQIGNFRLPVTPFCWSSVTVMRLTQSGNSP